MEHYLLHCPRLGAQRQEMSDLIAQNDAQASMANMLKEVGRLARLRRGSNNRGCRAGAHGWLLLFLFLFLFFLLS